MSIWIYILVIALGDVAVYDDVQHRIQMLDPWARGTHSPQVAACVPSDDRTIPLVSQEGRASIGDVAEIRWSLFSLSTYRYKIRGRATFT